MERQGRKLWKRLGGIAGVGAWIFLVAECWYHRGALTVENLSGLAPENLWLAFMALIALFAVKSVTVFLYCGILYAASGVLFPLPAALAVNLFGTAVMVTIPYLIGRRRGMPALDRLEKKYPKMQAVKALHSRGDFMFSFLSRVIKVISSDLVSFYMGASGTAYLPYLCGCLLGMLPPMLTFPIMGMRIRKPGSPEFVIALLFQIVYSAVCILSYVFYRRRRAAAGPGGAEL